MRLFSVPLFFNMSCAFPRTEEVISFTVVLPLEPVIPATGMLKRLLCQAAISPKALTLSVTFIITRAPSMQFFGMRSAITPRAPFLTAS